MTGEQLKNKLRGTGRSIADVAKILGMSRQNLSKALQSQDVKTGLVENMAAALGMPISYFFEENIGKGDHAIANGDSSVAAVNSIVEGNAVLSARIEALNNIVKENERMIAQKERTIKILMNK